MTDSLKDFLVFLNKNSGQLDALAVRDPATYSNVANFKARATDPNMTYGGNVEIDWPAAVKSEWTKKYKLLESYAKSTDANAVEPWTRELDHLQIIEYGKLVETVPAPKIDWRKIKPSTNPSSPPSGNEASGTP